MGTQPRSVKGDDDATRMRNEIAETRDHMGRTLDELHGKFNPTVLKEQALEQFHDAKETIKAEMRTELENAKGRMQQEVGEAKTAAYDATVGKVEHMVSNARTKVRETGNTVYVGIKSNPIPVAIAGLGIAWLVMNMRSSSGSRRISTGNGGVRRLGMGDGDGQQRLPFEEAKGAVSRTVEQIEKTAGDYGKAAQEKAGELGEQAGQVVNRAQESLHDFAQTAKEQGRRVEDRIERAFDDNPLAVGLAVVALGVGIGLAIPISRKEQQWMGPARERLASKVEKAAHEALEKAEELGTQAVDATAQQLQPAPQPSPLH